MSSALLFIPILLPIIIFGILKICNFKNEKTWKIISVSAVALTSIIVWIFLFIISEDKFVIVSFSSRLSLSLKLDGLGKIFAGMVSILWPVALLYSFVYMKHDKRKYVYNAYYVATFGVVLGIAMSGNLLTMYIFYELLTFITLPLIIHPRTKEARRAGNYYLYFSLSGSSLALAGLIIYTIQVGNNDFLLGNSAMLLGNDTLSQVGYLFAFLGFGVKAAVFPLCFWLPMAGAAPTPTTALLHAVAVVKAGAFAIMRVTFYLYSFEGLNGSWVQKVCLGIICFTIVYGSSMALKEQHLKRRFAYSTIANLSYILFGVLLCTGYGLEGALVHFLFHSITKISIFFVCGAIIEETGATYVYQLNGLGKKMPILFTIYTIGGLSLIGVPLFAGFVSKFYLIKAAFLQGSVFAYLGIAALIISAILTIVYVMSIAVRAFIRKPLEAYKDIEANAKEADKGFLLTCGIFAICCVVFGIYAQPIINVIETVIGGIL